MTAVPSLTCKQGTELLCVFAVSSNVPGNVSLYFLTQAVAKDLVTSGLVGLGSQVLPNSVIPAGGQTSFSLTGLSGADVVVAVQYTCESLQQLTQRSA